jgi:hypothetical protein
MRESIHPIFCSCASEQVDHMEYNNIGFSLVFMAYLSNADFHENRHLARVVLRGLMTNYNVFMAAARLNAVVVFKVACV